MTIFHLWSSVYSYNRYIYQSQRRRSNSPFSGLFVCKVGPVMANINIIWSSVGFCAIYWSFEGAKYFTNKLVYFIIFHKFLKGTITLVLC